MPGPKIITMLVKSMFLDSRKIESAVDRAKLRNLTKAGGYTRKVAKSLLRKRGKPGQVSAPGTPPLQHTGLLRGSVFYDVDRAAESAVIGPTLKPRKGSSNMTPPQVLEFGGTVTRMAQSKYDFHRRRYGRKLVRRRFRYPARPYMGPALAIAVERGKVLDVWRNSVRAY